MKPPTIYGMTEEEWKEEREKLYTVLNHKLIKAVEAIVKSFHPAVEKD